MKLAKITSVYRSRLIYKTYKNWFDKDQKVLDIGCGTGIVLHELKKSIKLREVVGCDIENYLIVDIPFKKMNNQSKLPFKNKEFDIAMFNDILHHTSYENQKTLLKEALRVAETALLFELKPTLIGKAGDYLINKIHNPNMNIPYTYNTRSEWEKLFENLGFSFKVREVNSPIWYPFKHISFKILATQC